MVSKKKTQLQKLLDKSGITEHYIYYCPNCGDKIDKQVITIDDLKIVLKEELF